MNKIRFILVLLGLLLITGCNVNVDTIVNDYNSKFTVKDDFLETQPGPGDPDFDENFMLLDIYCVGDHETVNLAAPSRGCDDYLWIVNDMDALNEPEVTVNYFDGTNSCTSRLFVAYIPESGLKAGKTYKLTLIVKGTNGKTYKDVCELVIYKHYDFSPTES